LPPPEAYGLNGAFVTLEAYSEIFESPEPVAIETASRATLTDSALEEPDPALDFGAMRMEQGIAYFLGRDLEGIPVTKSWERLDGRQFLIESVAYPDLVPLLEQLQAEAGVPETATWAGRTVQGRSDVARAMQPRKPGPVVAAIQPSSRGLDPGLVVDYLLTLNSSETNYVFRGDSTYRVVGTTYLYGTTVLEGGAVIKADAGSTVQLQSLNGSVECQTSPGRPAIFTAKDDNSVGETISGSTGNPSGTYAQYGLYCVNPVAPVTLEHLQVRHAAYGLLFGLNDGHTIRHCQLVDCGRAFWAWDTTLRLENVLVNRASAYALYLASGATAVGEHLTIDGAALVAYPANSLTLTNSLLVGVTNWTYAFSGAHNATNSSTDIFQWAGAGAHYLATGSPYRNAGSTNINAALLSELRQRTTYPPVTLTSPIGTATTLGPVVQRDSDGSPDLGYHYSPLDYLASNVVVQAALTFTNGVAIGGYGTRWFELGSGSSVIGEGSPLQPVRLVHVQNVQEQGRAWGAGPQFHHTSATNSPSLRFRFSEHSASPGVVGTLYSAAGDYPLQELSFQHCTLWAGSFGLYPVSASAVTIALTNNLVDRCSLVVGKAYNALNTPLSVFLYNNLFRGGDLTLHYYDGTQDPVWAVKDNLFAGASQSFYKDSRGNTQVQRSYNGFATNTTTVFGGASSFTNLVTDFQSLPSLGRYYYPASGGSTSLTNLVNRGSRLASSAGLYHFTTTTNQVKEATSQVDIGLHYVAVDASTGLPLDYDGDGLADVLEDRNGEGSSSAGETNWQQSENGTTGVPGLQVFAPWE
jgi:hypothetical protein